MKSKKMNEKQNEAARKRSMDRLNDFFPGTFTIEDPMHYGKDLRDKKKEEK